ncbi:PREDICTED: cyclin-dependent protein kinase inhibitor SMR3 [Tarenaya hassleriana]|uniref:cyclin-dependent protein kinase inhibitor SMR3 n=1 Tax=Tarenaya hassleriana TaxID=28532 RepID=UPI00053C8141|nr:PREDICTED: cyclin-dependent protein kinase inhibitor SMR3 [Tarenaya hassleriana]
MVELCCVKEIKDEVEIRLTIRPELDLAAGQECPAIQNGGDDDGCMTPTSSAHKIPAVKRCPPPPRKPRRNRSVKREFTSSEKLNRIPVTLSREIELFLENLDRRIKKSRREEEAGGYW